MITFLVFVGMILFLVGVHEGGHFLAAKSLGVAVEEFAIGFGPALWSRQRGETRYSIRLLPLGGYVRLAGESGEATEVPFERTYYGRPPWVRLLVSLAGPVMNVLAAVVLAIAAFGGFGLPRVQVVGLVRGGPAEEVLQVGDAVLSIGGQEIWSPDEVGPAIQAAAPGPIPFRIRRDEAVLTVEITPEWEPEDKKYLVGALFPPTVLFAGVPLTLMEDLAPDSPLGEVGLRPGDQIVSACGEVRSLYELADAFDRGCREVEVERGGETLTLTLPDMPLEQLFGGASFRTLPSVYGRRDPLTTLELGFGFVGSTFAMFGTAIGMMVFGEVGVGEAFTGPVGIAGILSQGLAAGGLAILLLISLISVNLAVFNLIPFPALDGARMLFSLWELLSRRRVSPAVENAVHAIGFILLLGFLLLVTYQDIMRLFG